ncbi:MAG TPA: hypothetical protein VHN98_03595 [Acidimicrobiales bacterium]|nr:hypothetical protein [Acidimicrobiales bacterium]
MEQPSDAFCRGCGLPAGRCAGECGRRGGLARFCPACGRRLQEIVVFPGVQEHRCRDHGPPPDPRVP